MPDISSCNISACTSSINHICRIVIAIGKHIVAEDALTGGGEGICIEESAQLGIVITGLEVVERGLGVVI